MDKRGKKTKKGDVIPEPTPRPSGPTTPRTVEVPVQTIGDYQCTGNLEVDFTKLCVLARIRKIPVKEIKQPVAASTRVGVKETTEGEMPKYPMTTWTARPYLQVEMSDEGPRIVKKVKIGGWKVDEVMMQLLRKILPSMNSLQILQLWRNGLTDLILTSLNDTLSLCSNLRMVILDDNPIPEQSYHILIGESSTIAELWLRHNHITEEGARLIGLALSTPYAANKSLRSLNMNGNDIGDAGAIHIAKGLRFNRTLVNLSLANNHIGDLGGARLAEVLSSFPLTHEEVVERRKILIKRDTMVVKQEEPPKDETPTASQKVPPAGKKEEQRGKKNTSEKVQGKGGKAAATKDKQPSAVIEQEQKPEEVVEIQSPFLDPEIYCTDGKIIMPGNKILTSLNLSGNKLTERSLEMFLMLLGMQKENGLLRLCLDRNRFPLDSEDFIKIQEILSNKVDKTQST